MLKKRYASKTLSDGFEVEVWNDDDCPESPRGWYPVGIFKNEWRRKNYIPDEADAEDMENAVIKLPVSFYDHSGVKVWIGGPRGSDSSQCGWYIATKEKIELERKKDESWEDALARCREIMNSEVETYNRYLNGEVYCLVLKDPSGWVEEEIGGFYEEPEEVLAEAENYFGNHNITRYEEGEVAYMDKNDCVPVFIHMEGNEVYFVKKWLCGEKDSEKDGSEEMRLAADKEE